MMLLTSASGVTSSQVLVFLTGVSDSACSAPTPRRALTATATNARSLRRIRPSLQFSV